MTDQPVARNHAGGRGRLPLVFSLALLCGLLPSPLRAQVRAGHEVVFGAESAHPYLAVPGRQPAWSARVEHPGATYIAVHFERFELARGDRVVVRSDSGRQRHVLTERGRHGLGTFWASHIKGDAAVVELFTTGRQTDAWGVSIDRYAAGTVDLGSEPDFTTEAVCGTDERKNAVCYQVTEAGAYDQSRAVARLLINGTCLCTGWLVGCQGHFITNNHCIDHNNDPLSCLSTTVDPVTAVMNTDFEFMAETPSCNTVNGDPPLQFPGPIWPGTPTLVQRDFGLDYAYIQLAGSPEATYGSFQVENRAPIADERIFIPQHPGGRAKEIALESSDPTDESGFCEVTDPQSGIKCTGGGPGDVTYQCDSQGGSSGSPVVSYDSLGVIALHHCSLLSGSTPICPNLGVPINAIITDLGANLPACAIADAVTDLTHDTQSVVDDDTFGNNNGALDPFEIVTLSVDLRNDGNFLATNVSAVLTTTTPGVTIQDDTADWPTVPGFASRTSLAPHFVVHVADTVPCGTLIAFDLAISSDQGAFNASFEQLVGDVGTTGSWASPDVPQGIPDNDPGITSDLSVFDSFTIGDITVSLDITHPRIGDLEVDLASQGGTSVRLHNRSGGTADDIVTTYDTLTVSDGPGSMLGFNGENSSGTWSLTVTDNQNNEVGTLNSWSLSAAESATPVCSPVPCEVFAAADATPTTVCAGDPATLADAGSSEFGDDCSGTLEYRFKLFSTTIQDWSPDPDVVVTPSSSNSYEVTVRDQATLAQDLVVVPVTVLAAPTASVSQTPDPMCLEYPSVDLDAGAGFASYTWRDDGNQVVGSSQILSLDAAACGRTYSVEVGSGNGCSDTADLVVSCQSCAPAEVSPAGSAVPLRMGLDASNTIEFELLPGPPGVIYHLYHADTVASFLAGDWTTKFCDLGSGAIGTWTPINATTVQWTPTFPGAIAEGYWVAIAESSGVEGAYGVMTGGAPRPPDTDGAASGLNIGCP